MKRVGSSLLVFAGVLCCACGQGDDENPFETVSSDTGAGSAADGSGPSGSGMDDDGGDEGPKFDTPNGDGDGDCDCGNNEWSHIWIADHKEGFVSKMDTRTMTELARYTTRPDGEGSPSRTSVSLSGRSVAVANRHGGLIKIWADEKFCDDENGMAGIQTSSGKDDVLAWGEDECVDWYTPFPEFTTQRPVAFAPGVLEPGNCKYTDEHIWTAGCGGGNPGYGGGVGGITVHRVEGDSGELIDDVVIDEFICESYGPYGGAVNGDGSFWVMGMNGYLAYVDGETTDYQVWEIPRPQLMPYGIAVDSKGRPWVTSYSVWSSPRPAWGAGRFDPETETWAFVEEEFASQSGLSETADGKMWIGTHNLDDWGMVNNGGHPGTRPTGVMEIDADTLQIGKHYAFDVWAKGIAFDKDGYLWGVGWSVKLFDSTHHALKIEPATGQFQSYTGIEKPYTYSDMTGWGVQNAACKPEG
jgi:hypothetical protein